MGRIKTSAIKRASRQLVDRSPEIFSEDFSHNKVILADNMSSKRVRNKIAGQVARLKKQNQKIIKE